MLTPNDPKPDAPASANAAAGPPWENQTRRAAGPRRLDARGEYIALQEKINQGLRQFIDEMTLVFRFIETVNDVHAQARILEMLMQVTKELVGYSAAVLYLYPPLAGEAPEPAAPAFAVAAPEIESAKRALKIDETIYEWVDRQGRPAVFPGAATEAGNGEPGWSFMLVPLRTAAGSLGRIEMKFLRPAGAFTQQTFSILEVLLKHAALILQNENSFAQQKKAAAKYMELDRLKQDIVTTTTHEIKTPLTIINATALMLKRRPKQPPQELRRMLDSMARQCERINRISGQLFETNRLEDGPPVFKPQHISLGRLTSALIKDQHADRKRFRFEVNIPGGVEKVWADFASLEQVLRNLIENAIKYSPQGGTIFIRAKTQKHQVIWQIKDPGIGIPEQEQAKIFEKFYRVGDSTTRKVSGLGFGLYLAKKNAELNGGVLSVKSKVGAGSTFTFGPAQKETEQLSKWMPKLKIPI